MNKITPYSGDLVFFDTEFSSLNFDESVLLSFGAVKLNGEEFYCEVEVPADAVMSDWVSENILTGLTAPKLTMDEARAQIAKFMCGTSDLSLITKDAPKPFLVTYVYKYDAYHWFKLFGFDDKLSHKIILDFASMLFAVGINPEDHSANTRDGFLRKLGIDPDKYTVHNALDDAKILRDAYMAMIKKG